VKNTFSRRLKGLSEIPSAVGCRWTEASHVGEANGGEGGTNYWVATAGSHTVTANVNSVNRITETDKTNNTLSASIPTTAPKSDLIVTAVSPGVAATGSNVVPSATVKNQGAGATPAGTTLGVTFKIEGTSLRSDTNTASLAPGASML